VPAGHGWFLSLGAENATCIGSEYSDKPLDMTTVAFQGVPGAYSELAAFQHFGKRVKPVAFPEFADVFKAVLSGKTAYGIVPIENSLTGSIHENFDLLLEKKVWICGETKLRVSHSLIAHPKASLKSIRHVYSHPQALGQCRTFLRKLKGVEGVPYFDTAGSVKFVAESGRTDIAAVASQSAAKRYGMKVLKAAIESNPHNYTRFLILCKKPRKAKGPRLKTSIVFDLKSRPRALHLALGAFAGPGIQLLKIESRPIPGRPWEYLFYLDFEGDVESAAARLALAHLKELAIHVKILGSYPAQE